jgi:Zn-dependent metalloprotease
MSCNCFIIPEEVLGRFAHDPELSPEERAGFKSALIQNKHWRAVRDAQLAMTTADYASLLPPIILASAPHVTVYDCNHSQTLPGAPVANPDASADATAKRAFVETTSVAKFYQAVFNRNSVDAHGMTLQSSIHYGVKYNNAFWNGTQMTYGDGDGNIFIDFTKGNDVIGHELTHGVTQHSAQFVYQNQPGGLNESVSDVFGSMFRQWEANQDVNHADWLIGHDIMGPGAIARGFTCLRDMSNPAATHCLSPQPTNFSQYHDGMDPHQSSGIPNFAFCKAAKAVGGKSWEKTGQIWYKALTGFAPSPNMTMKDFANRTRTLAHSMYPALPVVASAVDSAWTAVGL